MKNSYLRLVWIPITLLIALVATSCGGGPVPENLAISITADATEVLVETTVQLEATLQGPDADSATITWSSDPESGAFNPATGKNTTWTSPDQAGSYELTGTVTSNGKTSTDNITITVEDPCVGIVSCSLIRNLADLQAMNDNLGGYYIVVNDVDASDTKTWIGVSNDGFEPIGTKADPFTGTLDGQNHSIDGLHIKETTCEDPAGCSLGLFGFTAITAEIRDVSLTAIDFTGVSDVGGLVGRNEGIIKNSNVSGELTGANLVGGLVGMNLGRIENSNSAASTASVDLTTGFAGGLAARNMGRITNSHSSGSVNNARFAGGLVGVNSVNLTTSVPGLIENSSSSSTVNGGEFAGGLAGSNEGVATVTGSHSTGNVTGNKYVGGLTGTNLSGTISTSYSSGTVTGHEYVGGLIGFNQYGHITSSYSTSNVTSLAPSGQAGGLVGFNGNDASGKITGSFSTGSVSGQDMVGGLVGRNQDGTITTSYSTSVVKSDAPEGEVGGLVAYNEGTITNSYATGSTTGGEYAGGLVGRNVAGSVEYSYSTGVVQATDVVGGLIAGTTFDSVVTDSYWDTQTSGEDLSYGGEGKTTAEMQTASTFASWSTSVWSTGTGAYPDLRGNPRP